MLAKGVLMLRSTWQQQMAQVMQLTSGMGVTGACDRMNRSTTELIKMPSGTKGGSTKNK